MNGPLPAERPGCRLGSAQLPLTCTLQPASGPLLIGHQLFAAGLLGQGQHGGQTAALRAGKAGALLRPVAVGEDGHLVIRRERALNGAERVVHLGHHVGGQALVDHKGNRKRERVHGEQPQRLARAVLKHLEVAPGETGNELPFESFTVTGTSTKFTFRRMITPVFSKPCPVSGISGGVVWTSSLTWLGGCCWGAAEVEDEPVAVGAAPVPSPGVMGPVTSDNGPGVWGARGIGYGRVAGCWAKAAVLRIRLELKSAASAVAVKPSFTGISSSRTPLPAPERPADTGSAPAGLRPTGLHSSEYQTRQSRAGCPPAGKEFAVCSLRGPRFRLSDQNAHSLESCRFAARPAGLLRGGMGPACSVAGRSPGEHRAAGRPMKTSRWRPSS